jgi:hypothetical protein
MISAKVLSPLHWFETKLLRWVWYTGFFPSISVLGTTLCLGWGFVFLKMFIERKVVK